MTNRLSDDRQRLAGGVERQSKRLRQAERDEPTILAQVRYLGGVGLVFLLPVIGGAYLGQWLDSLAAGYSVRWTVSLIVTGVAIGAVNVYFFLRE
ncbi:MAG: AtpZ/AtpI family protein [Bryobacteraceae bacterium]